MYNVLLCIGYDGTAFHGYQKQANGRTVQQELEQGLSLVLKTKISLHSAGRTDAGVHAERQYINFKIAQYRIPIDRICYAVNTVLPSDIRVFWSKEVPAEFHARYSALSRSYYYQIHEGHILSPSLRNYVASVPKGLDWDEIQKDIICLIGTHDFSSFASCNSQITHSIRTIDSIDIVDFDTNIKRIYITANGFLWKMVRTIIGTCIDRAKVRASHNPHHLPSMYEILAHKNRAYGGQTAPPWGLFLYNIQYKEEYGITTQ